MNFTDDILSICYKSVHYNGVFKTMPLISSIIVIIVIMDNIFTNIKDNWRKLKMKSSRKKQECPSFDSRLLVSFPYNPLHHQWLEDFWFFATN